MPMTAKSASSAGSSATSRSCAPKRTSRRSGRRRSAAAVLVWENTWKPPFGSAVCRSGGELLGSGRIPTHALIAAAEADRQAAIKGA